MEVAQELWFLNEDGEFETSEPRDQAEAFRKTS